MKKYYKINLPKEGMKNQREKEDVKAAWNRIKRTGNTQVVELTLMGMCMCMCACAPLN